MDVKELDDAAGGGVEDLALCVARNEVELQVAVALVNLLCNLQKGRGV